MPERTTCVSTARTMSSPNKLYLSQISTNEDYDHHELVLPLPMFSGRQSDWVMFIQEFEQIIHSDSGLLPAIKFLYLRCCLHESVKPVIDGFQLKDYDQAMNCLKQRHGDRDVNVQCHVTAILDLESPTTEPDSLLKFYDKLNFHIRILDQLECTSDKIGSMLLCIVKRKVPWQTGIQINRNCANPHNISLYLDSLYQEILLLRDCALPSASLPSVQSGKGPCAFCKIVGHSPLYCTHVQDSIQCLEIVRRDRLCFGCLGPHQMKNCRSKFTCRVCKGPHHTTLHDAFCSQTDVHTRKWDNDQNNDNNDEACMQTKKIISTTSSHPWSDFHHSESHGLKFVELPASTQNDNSPTNVHSDWDFMNEKLKIDPVIEFDENNRESEPEFISRSNSYQVETADTKENISPTLDPKSVILSPKVSNERMDNIGKLAMSPSKDIRSHYESLSLNSDVSGPSCTMVILCLAVLFLARIPDFSITTRVCVSLAFLIVCYVGSKLFERIHFKFSLPSKLVTIQFLPKPEML